MRSMGPAVTLPLLVVPLLLFYMHSTTNLLQFSKSKNQRSHDFARCLSRASIRDQRSRRLNYFPSILEIGVEN